MSEINIQPEDLQIVKDILKKLLYPDVKVWVLVDLHAVDASFKRIILSEMKEIIFQSF